MNALKLNKDNAMGIDGKLTVTIEEAKDGEIIIHVEALYANDDRAKLATPVKRKAFGLDDIVTSLQACKGSGDGASQWGNIG